MHACAYNDILHQCSMMTKCMVLLCRHPVARHRPMPNSVSQTLQKSNNSLLSSPVTDDAEQSMMLGEPLSAGNQLYLDLQQTYLTNIAN